MFQDKKVILVTGGTFGHVYPALMILKICGPGSMVFINENCKRFIKKTDEFEFFDYQRTFNPIKNLKQIIFFWKQMKNFDTLIVFGGYTCFPATVASLFRRVATYFHEQNANLSLGNLFSYFLRFIPLLSFKHTMGLRSFFWFKKPIYFGYPVQKVKANKLKEKSIFVFAGSGASDFFDDFVAPVVSDFAKKNGYKVYFAAKNVEKVKKLFESTDVIKNFFFDIDSVLAKVEIVISRAGAGAISKAVLFNNKTILIPLQSSTRNHQTLNAKNSGLEFIEEQNIKLLYEKMIDVHKNNIHNSFILKFIT